MEYADKFSRCTRGSSQNNLITWSGAQQLSFLMNTYNAFTIKLILDNYPGTKKII